MLLGRTLHERLRTFDLEELYRQTGGLYDFADARGLQPIAVRIVESPPAGTALEVNVPDAPFLVDTVRAAVQGAGHGVRLLLHPIVGVERDAEGRIVRITDAREASGRESVMRLELERHLAREEGEALVAAVREALRELQLAVGDFAAMLADGRAHGDGRARGRGRAHGGGGRGDGGLPRVAARRALHPARRPRLHDRGGRLRARGARPGRLGPRHPARRRRVALRASRRRSTSCPSSCASASSRAATCS